ncbi:hypothetical protein BTR25_14275 [Bacillus sp. MRMR6]|nr:hypothetical protein BTR25_14275 [Bacillus sp. MRMR6]
MKKEFLLVAASFFLMSVTLITGVYAIENDDGKKGITISKIETDLTGDGNIESLYLKGVPYKDDENFLRSIYMDIETKEGNKIHIPLESGNKAALKLIDINGDGIKEVLTNVYIEGNNGTINSYLYSLKDGVQTELTIPDPIEMESHFENGYKAKLTIKPTGKTYSFDLRERKKYYKKLGLYYNGKLNEPTELKVNSFSTLKPTRTSTGLMGLKGIQKITGIANGDTIAYVVSSWSYRDGNWTLVDTIVRTADDKK